VEGAGLVPWVGVPVVAFFGFSKARRTQKRYYTTRVVIGTEEQQ